MKISVPFYVFETQCAVGEILRVIFRSNPENKTMLRGIFVPRNIETKAAKPSQPEGVASAIRMWANGVYVTAVSDGYTDSNGDQAETVSVHIKAKRLGYHSTSGYGAKPKSEVWAEFQVPISELLQAEKNASYGIPETEPSQVEARAQQAEALRAIHAVLAG